jgi:hypothetical protein
MQKKSLRILFIVCLSILVLCAFITDSMLLKRVDVRISISGESSSSSQLYHNREYFYFYDSQRGSLYAFKPGDNQLYYVHDEGFERETPVALWKLVHGLYLHPVIPTDDIFGGSSYVRWEAKTVSFQDDIDRSILIEFSK